MNNLPKTIETSLKKSSINIEFLDIIDHPVLKVLFEFVTGIPIISGILFDTVIKTWSNIQKQKTVIFFNELKNNPEKLHEGLLNSEAFIHKFMITYKAVLETYNMEKIKFFARLLKNSVNDDDIDYSIENYEEYLKILTDLSYREILVLFLIDNYFEKYLSQVNIEPKEEYTGSIPLPKSNDSHEQERAAIKIFRKELDNQLEKEFLIPREVIKDFLIRLSRSRLYEQVNYIGGETGDGYPTPLYRKIKELIYEDKLK
ncbi:MAG TPA: hypothetical protein PKA10_07740 [Selenomonadales bacterium]|nr:hypothetical protein [Selenomonadales bacterium]